MAETCRGSIMLGSGCGTCDRCKKEIEEMRTKIQKMDKHGKQNKEELAGPGGAVGWTCPRCGAGNSPFASRCNCVPLPLPIVTC